MMWSMHHKTLIKQWDSISIPVSSSLDHYTTNGGTWFQLLVLKTRVIDEYIWGVVGGHVLIFGVIDRCPTWYLHHIEKQKNIVDYSR